MKKIYSFLLMATALFIGTNLQAEVRTAGTFAELKAAIDEAANGDIIKLTADIDYGQVTYESNLNITKSITLDGQGHTLKGGGQRQDGNSTYATVWINLNGTEDLDVTFKDIKIINRKSRDNQGDFAIHTRGKPHSLTLQGVYLESPAVPLQLGGNHTGLAYTTEVTIRDSYLHALTYYPILSWNKYNLHAYDTKFEGWCSLYFKGVNGSIGSRGSVIEAENCQFNAPNVHSGISNAFGMFVCEDDGISITLNNCSMDAEQLGDQSQAVLVLSGSAATSRRSQAVTLTINGDNSYINGKWVDNGWPTKFYSLGTDEHGKKIYAECYSDGSFFVENPETGIYDVFAFKNSQYAFTNYTAPINLVFTGGTYSQNPESPTLFPIGITPVEAEDEPGVIQYGAATIPAGYEVSELTTNQNGQETTLYRVRKTITTSYNINDNVEEQGDGQNANTEFKITADDEIAENIDEVVANYVEVSNNATLTVGEGKTLEVTNGMDVKEGAQVVVEPGATLVVGEGGAIAEETSGIVIESSQSNPASFIMDPAVIVNTTPNLTVRMIANAGVLHIDDQEEWYWHRFAIPVNGISKAADFEASTPGITYVQYFDWTANAFNGAWKGIGGLSQLKPFIGYRLGYDLPYNDLTQQGTEMTYTFRGQLAGNQNTKLDFQHRGWNFFGNSYTAYVRTLTLLNEITGGDENIAGTIYLWNGEGFVGVTLNDLRNNNLTGREWMAEVAPMTTFILQLRGASSAEGEINYTTTIWENERYGRVPASAPARVINDDDMYARMIITSANGRKDDITLTENAKFTDEYDNGADANQFFNAGTVNVYANVAGEQLTSVATDNLEGKLITVNTTKDTRYTMSFVNVIGNKYAVKDMLTGTVINIADNSTYEFVADENSVNENRFMIVGRAEMPTDAEVVEATAAQKGIYTIMGQYIGETDIFNSLPAGVYVVDGVKVVK